MSYKIYPGPPALENKITKCYFNSIESDRNPEVNIEDIMNDNEMNKKKPISMIKNFVNKETITNIQNKSPFIRRIETIQSPAKFSEHKKSYLDEEAEILNNEILYVDLNDSALRYQFNSPKNENLTRTTAIGEKKELMPEIALTREKKRFNSIAEENNLLLTKAKIPNNEIKLTKITDDSPIYQRESSTSTTNSM